jgi:FtsZ-interacting cell division protein ZipA
VRLLLSYTGDSGVAKSVEKDRTLWAMPLWLVVAVGVLLALLVLTGVWAASRRAAERSAERRSRDTASESWGHADSAHTDEDDGT